MRFTAEKTEFDDQEGYWVKQYKDGQIVTEQFVTASGYADFCKLIGVIPDLLEERSVE